MAARQHQETKYRCQTLRLLGDLVPIIANEHYIFDSYTGIYYPG